MGGLGFLVEASTILHYDNQSVIQVADNPIAHSKLKHVKIHVHYLRKLVQEKIYALGYWRIDDQLIDIYTKPLLEANFVKFLSLLGI